jgi:hypothetical protein
MEPSKREAELFASIVARIGDPERRRLRLIVIVVLVLRWPWPAAVSFAVMCVVGVVAGLLLMAPELFRRSR